MTETPFALAVHGGAGTIAKTSMTPDREAAYNSALGTALEAGEAVLRDGGAALDAVCAAVCALEMNLSSMPGAAPSSPPKAGKRWTRAS